MAPCGGWAAALLCSVVLCQMRVASAVTGVIRNLGIDPLACHLKPSPFVPEAPSGQAFYLIECPVDAEHIALTFTSTFPLLSRDGFRVPSRLTVHLATGEARLVQVRACGDGQTSGLSCTAYQFDVHRLASAQAALAQILVTADQGRQDCPLSPTFSPSVPAYRAMVPFGAEVDISAEAATGGFASFASFAAAEQHAVSRHFSALERGSRSVVHIYAVAPDQHGQRKYTVILLQEANSDTTLASIRSNVGKVLPLAGKASHLYILKVPKSTRRVALSATASDRQGTTVALHGRSGSGFASAVVTLPDRVPYELVHLRVTAADQVTFGNYVIVVCHGFRQLALLSSLVVKGCKPAMEPAFGPFVHEYQCQLGRLAETMTVVPTAIWLPRTAQPVKLSMRAVELRSGEPYTVPVDLNGNAVARIVVRASDGVHTSVYVVRGIGSPWSVRHPTTITSTTTYTTLTMTTFTYTTFTMTTRSATEAVTAATIPSVAQSTVSASTLTSTTTAAPTPHFHAWKPPHWKGPHMELNLPNWSTAPHFSAPKLGWHMPTRMPEIPTHVYVAMVKSITFSSALALMAGAPAMPWLMIVMKHMQFAVLATDLVAPHCLTGELTHPLGIFCMWLSWFGQGPEQEPEQGSSDQSQSQSHGPEPEYKRKQEPEQEPEPEQEQDQEREREQAEEEQVLGVASTRRLQGNPDKMLGCKYRAGCLKILCVVVPLTGLLFAWGWWRFSQDEDLGKQSRRPRLLPQLQLLPCALAIFDFCLLPFTDAVAYFTFNGAWKDKDSQSNCAGPPSGVLSLLAAFPVGFCMLAFVHLQRLESAGRLVWGSRFQFFGDAECRTVTLHGPSYSVAASGSRIPALCRCLLARELRDAVAVVDPDTGGSVRPGVLQNGLDHEPAARGFSEQRSAGERTEAEAGLLPRTLMPALPWRRRQQHLSLLLWMEQRCAAHETLKQQIEGAERHLAITDVSGLPILDALGEPLNNLYQYCVYQFPWRPWRVRSLSPVTDPYEFEGGIVAPWVPPAEELGDLEKGEIDTWLQRWLMEAETVIRARDEWRQLRVREYNSQTREYGLAILREMMIALLQSTPLRLPGPQRLAQDVEERELRLGELLQERLRKGEARPWQHDEDASRLEAFVALGTEVLDGGDLRLTEEDTWQPLFQGSVFGNRRLLVHTPSEPSRLEVATATDSIARPPAGPLRTRRTPVACELPLRCLHLLATWMPAFGFGVPYDSLHLPVRTAWAPLFASASGPGTPRDGLLVDSLDRAVSVVALLAAHGFAGSADPAPLSPGLVLVLWSVALLLLRFFTGGLLLRWCFIWLPQAVFSVLLWLLGRQSQQSWGRTCLDRLCMGFMVVAMVFFAWHAVKDFVRMIIRLFSRKPMPSDEEGALWGRSMPVDGPLPFAVVVPLLGMCLHGEADLSEGICTEEQRRAVCRKQLAISAALQDEPEVGLALLDRLKEVEGLLPLEISRAQLAGTEEIHELACTIHVLNHVGCSWAEMKHDSFLSLYKPWGMDLPPAGAKETFVVSENAGSLDKTQQTAENVALLKAWRQEVLDWLHGELAAAGSIKHSALDTLLYEGRTDHAEFGRDPEDDLVPGIFSDGGLGENRHSESRCYQEGRVLHYVIPSNLLKVGQIWRPDPLATESAQLLCSEQWRPCLLRLTSRSVRYFLRKRDGADQGGPFPDWQEPVVRDHGDIIEHNVSFLFLDRVEVDVERGLVMLQERDPEILGDAVSVPEYAPRALPLVFRVGPESAPIWKAVVKRSRMSGRREYILNYVGPVREHPCIPNTYLRHGPEGEQLWDNGARYVGSWEAHVYHGHGELVDSTGSRVYRGQWDRGLKHGEGTYYFKQNNIHRVYSGQWIRDEFFGQGELRVLDDSLERLRRRQPYTICQYRGKFEVARGQFSPSIDLSTVEPQKHTALVSTYFPMRTMSRDSSSSSSTLLDERPMSQSCGEAPKDLAGQLYHLDGSDLAHCGPDDSCHIKYVDGTTYTGPCLAGAVPHGEHAVLVEPNGTRYEGGFLDGLRTGAGSVTLTNGIMYEGQLSYPGGRRDGNGRLVIPPDLHSTFGFTSYAGQFSNGIREGVGEAVFPNGATYKGEFASNQRHGHGCLTEAGKLSYDGPWDEDLLGDGTVSIVYASGHCFSGVARGGFRHGPGIMLEPNGDHWSLMYEGEWKKDRMHGYGTLWLSDGAYTGQFVWGDREGEGRFVYKFPKPGQPITAATEGGEPGPPAEERVYDGAWKADAQHGTGVYTDEYGHTMNEVVCERGALKTERKVVRKGFMGLMMPTQQKVEFAPFEVQRSPGKHLPGGHGLQAVRGSMTSVDPTSLQAIDTGSGHASGRARPPHLGLAGVPGSRWA